MVAVLEKLIVLRLQGCSGPTAALQVLESNVKVTPKLKGTRRNSLFDSSSVLDYNIGTQSYTPSRED